jgi:hypothetical protein
LEVAAVTSNPIDSGTLVPVLEKIPTELLARRVTPLYSLTVPVDPPEYVSVMRVHAPLYAPESDRTVVPLLARTPTVADCGVYNTHFCPEVLDPYEYATRVVDAVATPLVTYAKNRIVRGADPVIELMAGAVKYCVPLKSKPVYVLAPVVILVTVVNVPVAVSV